YNWLATSASRLQSVFDSALTNDTFLELAINLACDHINSFGNRLDLDPFFYEEKNFLKKKQYLNTMSSYINFFQDILPRGPMRIISQDDQIGDEENENEDDENEEDENEDDENEDDVIKENIYTDDFQEEMYEEELECLEEVREIPKRIVLLVDDLC